MNGPHQDPSVVHFYSAVYTKTETCEGFSIFEFQQLDLAAMDFSEVYADFMEAAKLPDEAAALVQIQQKIADYYAAHKP